MVLWFMPRKNASSLFVVQTGNNNPFRTVTGWQYSALSLANFDSDSDLELVVGGANFSIYRED